MIVRFRLSLFLLFIFNFLRANGNDICDMIWQQHTQASGPLKLFQAIGSTEDLHRDLEWSSNELMSLPDKVIYMNKIALLLALSQYVQFNSELTSYSLRLMDDLTQIYRIRATMNEKILERFLKSRFQDITAAIASDQRLHGEKVLSTNAILQCMRSNNLVSYTLRPFDTTKSEWNAKVLMGAQMYSWLINLSEFLNNDVRGDPDKNCKMALNRMIEGCTEESAVELTSTEAKTEQSSFRICSSFCINVLRTCFAPLLRSSNLDLHEVLRHRSGSISYNSIPKALNTFTDSLDAVHLSNVIINAVKLAQSDSRNLRLKLELFCGGNIREQESSATFSTTTTSSKATSTISEEQRAYYQQKLEDQRREIRSLVQDIGTRLSNVAVRYINATRFMTELEERYCVSRPGEDTEESKCWNGEAFGKYTKPVMPFTIEGQRANPELLISEEQIERDSKGGQDRSQTILESDGPQQPGVGYIPDRVLNDDIQSSGLFPDGLDIPTQLRPLPELIPLPGFPISGSDQVQQSGARDNGCPDDDEDCRPAVVPSVGERVIQVTSSQVKSTPSTKSESSWRGPTLQFTGAAILFSCLF